MQMLYSIGGALLTREQLTQDSQRQVLRSSRERPSVSPRPASKGAVFDTLGAAPGRPARSRTRGVTEFFPIGIGKPLSIEIREIYTGRFPRGLFGGARRSMLVTTAMKGLEVFSGAARAVNYLTRPIVSRSRLRDVDAGTSGTPVVYYSPALTQLNAVLTVEFAFDEFPEEAFDAVSAAAGIAGGIPAFAAAGPYLIIAGTLISLLGKLGETGFDTRADFTATIPLTLDRPGDAPLTADFRLCISEEARREIGNDYQLDEAGALVHRVDGRPYQGDSPYVVLAVDGREHPEREAFSPVAATAEMVKNFFGSTSIANTSIEVALEGTRLYNDWQFRNRALALDRQCRAEPDVTRKETLRLLRDATVRNIQAEPLRPAFK